MKVMSTYRNESYVNVPLFNKLKEEFPEEFERNPFFVFETYPDEFSYYYYLDRENKKILVKNLLNQGLFFGVVLGGVLYQVFIPKGVYAMHNPSQNLLQASHVVETPLNRQLNDIYDKFNRYEPIQFAAHQPDHESEIHSFISEKDRSRVDERLASLDNTMPVNVSHFCQEALSIKNGYNEVGAKVDLKASDLTVNSLKEQIRQLPGKSAIEDSSTEKINELQETIRAIDRTRYQTQKSFDQRFRNLNIERHALQEVSSKYTQLSPARDTEVLKQQVDTGQKLYNSLRDSKHRHQILQMKQRELNSVESKLRKVKLEVGKRGACLLNIGSISLPDSSGNFPASFGFDPAYSSEESDFGSGYSSPLYSSEKSNSNYSPPAIESDDSPPTYFSGSEGSNSE